MKTAAVAPTSKSSNRHQRSAALCGPLFFFNAEPRGNRKMGGNKKRVEGGLAGGLTGGSKKRGGFSRGVRRESDGVTLKKKKKKTGNGR